MDRSRADTSSPEAYLIRRPRRWFTHVLALVLLTAQFGMVVHASTHLRSDPHGTAAQLCGQCRSSSALQNMVGGASVAVLAVSVARQRVDDDGVAVSAPRQSFNAFRSRAPPTLL